MNKMQAYQQWADQFLKEETEPMSDSLSKAFISLTLMDMDKEGNPLPEAVLKTFQYKLIKARSDYVGLRITDPAITLLATLADSPGTAVMYVYAMRRKQEGDTQEDYTDPVGVADIAYTFPMGFLTKDALERMWDAQKVGGSNMLDVVSASDFE